MKLSIIQNLLLNNSLFKTSLVKILALTLLILFPISLFFLLTFNNFQDKRNLEKRFSIERIIADSIITNSKYGDLIYARARALELGKNLDLVDLGICDQNQDVFERPNEDRCKRRAQVNEEISTNSIILNTQKYDLEFRWKKEEQKIYEQISYSLLSSFIISILFLLPLQIYLLRFVLAKVQETTSSLVQDVLNPQLN